MHQHMMCRFPQQNPQFATVFLKTKDHLQWWRGRKCEPEVFEAIVLSWQLSGDQSTLLGEQHTTCKCSNIHANKTFHAIFKWNNICQSVFMASIFNLYLVKKKLPTTNISVALDDLHLSRTSTNDATKKIYLQIWNLIQKISISKKTKKLEKKHNITIPNAGEKNKNFPTVFKGHYITNQNDVLSKTVPFLKMTSVCI